MPNPKPKKSPAAAPKGAAKPLAPVGGPVNAIMVRARREQGRCRAGLKFTREPYSIALSALSESELAAIRNDPELIVEDIELSGDDAAGVLRVDGGVAAPGDDATDAASGDDAGAAASGDAVSGDAASGDAATAQGAD